MAEPAALSAFPAGIAGEAAEALRPEVVAVGHADELDGDPQAITGLAHAPFEHRAVTRSPSSCARALRISSAMPSQKYSWSRAGLMSAKGRTATLGALGASAVGPARASIESPRRMASREARTSEAEAGRRDGSFSRHRATRSSSSCGAVGLTAASLIGASCIIATIRAVALAAGNGCWPVAIWKRTTPSEKRSARLSAGCPASCSGAM